MNKVLLFFVSILFFATSMQATAATDVFLTRGQVASFYATAQDGCILSQRYVIALEAASRSGRTDDFTRSVYVAEFARDTCSNTDIRSASGFKQLDKWEFVPKNNEARLMTAVLLTNSQGGQEAVNIDLMWVATSDIWEGTVTNKFDGPGIKILTRFTGSLQEAAVMGTIGASTVAVTGSLEKVNSGVVTVTR
jgi:hypothetical protein